MDHFNYRNGELYAEDVSVEHLAETYGTPFFCYSHATLVRHYQVFSAAVKRADENALVCYSVKSNSNQAVIAALAAHGAGADCVSGGEILRATSAGIPGKKIIFAGVGKTDDEIALALDKDILQFNAESIPELKRISAVAASKNKIASIAVRVNPDVDAKTHDKITTGRKDDKFGIAFEQAREAYTLAASLPNINIHGLAVHIGSQITTPDPFRLAFKKTADLAETLRSEGFTISHLDLGGGLAAPYAGEKDMLSPEAYADVVAEAAGGRGFTLAFEPGRVISANAGILVSRLIYIKENDAARFYITDAAMNDLIRPSFYSAHHDIIPVQDDSARPMTAADIVGPVCETGDVFAKKREIRTMNRGELLALRSAGAYGAVMGSTYNTRPLAAEIMVSGKNHAAIRPRQEMADLIGQDAVPDFL